MASTRSSVLLAVAALLAVGCSATKLVLIPSIPIPEVEVKEKGADDFTALEGPTGTWTLEGKALKGPFSVRFSTKNSGYRVMDDVIPASFKSGSVYKTSQLMVD